MADKPIDLVLSLAPTEEDLLEAVKWKRRKILKQTAAGRDFDGREFAPYSMKRKYYHGGQKYSSYADFKRSLGSTNVDLRGVSVEHMLDQMRVQALGLKASIFIEGDAADRAFGHNEGTRTLPQRRFFDVADEDIEAMQDLIAQRIEDRWNRAA